MTTKYTIKPIEIDESGLNIIEKDIFIHPALYVGVGSVASGKSTLLANIIEFWQDIFENRIILFSPSLNDPIIDKLVKEDKIFTHFQTYDNGTLETCLQAIKMEEEMSKNKGNKWLICFDDMLSQLPKSNQGEAKYFNHYISRYRHYPVEGKVSIVMFSQYWKDFNPVVRNNISYIMFLGSHSEKNKKVYAEELSSLFNGSEDDFYTAWNDAKSTNKYDFLTLDFRHLKAYKNFEKLLYSRDKPETLEDVKPDTKNEEDATENNSNE